MKNETVKLGMNIQTGKVLEYQKPDIVVLKKGHSIHTSD